MDPYADPVYAVQLAKVSVVFGWVREGGCSSLGECASVDVVGGCAGFVCIIVLF